MTDNIQALLGFAVGFGLFATLSALSVWWRWRDKRALTLGLLRNALPDGLRGRDLVRASEGVIGRGEVYVILSKLQDDGLVERRDGAATDDERHPRPRYFLKVQK